MTVCEECLNWSAIVVSWSSFRLHSRIIADLRPPLVALLRVATWCRKWYLIGLWHPVSNSLRQDTVGMPMSARIIQSELFWLTGLHIGVQPRTMQATHAMPFFSADKFTRLSVCSSCNHNKCRQELREQLMQDKNVSNRETGLYGSWQGDGDDGAQQHGECQSVHVDNVDEWWSSDGQAGWLIRSVQSHRIYSRL